MGGACSTYGRKERFMQGIDGETGWKEPLGRPRCRWKYSIKVNLQEVL
jgi:hypothetical protein